MSVLNDLAAAVDDETSFVAFMNALMADWEDERRKERKHPSSPHGPGANGWENGSIGAFLEAASAWAQSTAGRDDSGINKNPWRRAAQILHAGKFYE